MSNNNRYQKGHASILFAMIVPVLFGVFMLGTDGSRALQQKARLQDATEVAALAISAHADKNKVDKGIPANHGSSVNRTIAADFISAYFPDAGITGPDKLTNLKITSTGCSKDCSTSTQQYSQYQIQASFKFDTWFPGNSAIVGFGDKIEVAGLSTAKRYRSGSPIDVMFVSDFSGSMSEKWNGEKKYKQLISIIKTVSNKLEKANESSGSGQKSTVGIAPFDHFVYRKKKKGGDCQKVADGDVWNVEHTRFNGKAVDYAKMITNIETAIDNEVCPATKSKYSATFYSIALTNDIPPFNTSIDNFKDKSMTASYQGLIEGYKHLRQGLNSKRLLVILSDGRDVASNAPTGKLAEGKAPTTKYPSGRLVSGDPGEDGYDSYQTIGKTLIGSPHLLCDKIRTGLSKNGEEVQLYLIGFDYKAGDTNKALDDCVGAGNILYADDKEEIEKRLLSLISKEEEIGHLK